MRDIHRTWRIGHIQGRYRTDIGIWHGIIKTGIVMIETNTAPFPALSLLAYLEVIANDLGVVRTLVY